VTATPNESTPPSSEAPTSEATTVAQARLRTGTLAGIAAYSLWGLFPLYFHSLQPAGALEILGHRIIWSFILVTLVLALRRDWSWLPALRAQPRKLASVWLAGIMLSGNWLIYVWAVNANRVVDASLGYFINPIITVAVGVLLFHEEVRPLQRVAVGLGAGAVLVLSIGYGEVPWIALSLAVSFASYSVLKKQANLDPIAALAVETSLLVPVTTALLAWGFFTDRLAIGSNGVSLDLRLVLLGVVTAIPLLLFGVATQRIPYVTIGLLQYITPFAQYFLGWLYFKEKMPPERLIGFALVWGALALLAADAVRSSRSASREAASKNRPSRLAKST
jgi:chloramphenicol-sensitive protein RarD